ncbi:uncharacterized protein LOC135128775 [Zophobas morio]|uniref:uncharacterized protein LOC135128775 n=1 Tax=Zophobas morio TaxID=2755281 RepID=UPI003083B199
MYNRIKHNKPDLLMHDLKINEIIITEVGITNKRIIPTMHRPFVTKHFRRYMNQMEVLEKIQAYMQIHTLKRTCDCILVDLKTYNVDAPMDGEELERLLDNL